MRRVVIRLGKRSYPVYLGPGIIRSLPRFLDRHAIPRQLSILTDRTVARYHLAGLRRILRSTGREVRFIVMPAGEG